MTQFENPDRMTGAEDIADQQRRGMIPVDIGIRTGDGCEHPEDQRTRSMFGDPDTSGYCKACQCVLYLEDGVWVAQPTGISSVRTTKR